MSEVSPPRQNVPVFNPKYFIFLGANIGGQYLDANYLKFPVSQYARQTFNSGIFLANSSNITFTDGTTQSTAPTSASTPTISDVITAGNDAAGLEVDNIVLKDGTCFITPPNGDNSLKIATTAYCDNAVAGLAPDIQQVLTSGNDATGLSLLNVVLNSATCSSTPSTGDNSLKVATTAFVGTAVNNALSSANATYTERLTGGAGLQTITIPTGCVKFDIIVVGTGGLAGPTNANPPSGGQTEYTLTASGTGGGAGVAIKEGITIPRQGNRYNNTLTYNNKGTGGGTGTGTEVILNGTSLCEVYGGGNGAIGVAGLGNTIAPVVDTTWGSWISFNGDDGQAGTTTTLFSPPYAGQIGGGNFFGGVIGNPKATSSDTAQLNQAGQGQTYAALTGPSYGFPPFTASPINYGGCLITWYIQA
jgi:hypothetical protein